MNSGALFLGRRNRQLSGDGKGWY